ncbi:MAG: hypothetical protein ACSHWU_00320 [Marinicella sp.]
MNIRIIFFLLFLGPSTAYSLNSTVTYEYSANEAHPFGQYNPSAPAELLVFSPLIGQAHCQSVSRIDQNNWAEPVEMLWTFRYVLNGTAVQDDTLKSDHTHSGSIRQFNAESNKWHVYYYTSRAVPDELPVWTGGSQGGDLVFWRAQKAPNGMEGFYRLTFYDISEMGYKWMGVWVDQNKTIEYPTWKIACHKIKAS